MGNSTPNGMSIDHRFLTPNVALEPRGHRHYRKRCAVSPRRLQGLVRTGRHGKDYRQGTQQGKPPFVFHGCRQPGIRDFTEAGVKLAEVATLRAWFRA